MDQVEVVERQISLPDGPSSSGVTGVFIWRYVNHEDYFKSTVRAVSVDATSKLHFHSSWVKIPRNHYRPVALPGLLTLSVSQMRDAHPDAVYRRPRLISYDGTPAVAGREALQLAALDLIRTSPHPNVQKYYGCTASQSSGLVTGIWVKREIWTLDVLLSGDSPPGCEDIPRPPLDLGIILWGLSAGIDHLHSLNISHNKINLGNVAIDSDGNPVIMGFDSWCPLDDQPPNTTFPIFMRDYVCLGLISGALRSFFRYPKRPVF